MQIRQIIISAPGSRIRGSNECQGCQKTNLSDVSQRGPGGIVSIGHGVSVGDSIEHDRNDTEDF